MASGRMDLTERDRVHLAAVGISPAEAERQIALLSSPPPPIELLRPCRIGDGIRSLDAGEHDELRALYRTAAAQGRCSKFVPSSGAATRMFKTLQSLWSESPRPSAGELARRNDDAALEAQRLLEQLDRLPFFEALDAALATRGEDLGELVERGDPLPALSALLSTDGLALAHQAKGLLPFHRYADGLRTAFEEQLVEGCQYLRDDAGVCRFHFTVAGQHRPGFEELLDSVRPPLQSRFEVDLDVGFSVQRRSTDTLALDVDGGLSRRPDGSLVLRPAGHGALIENLSTAGADVVFVKNIDNVLPESRHALICEWKELLGGYLVRLQTELFDILERLQVSLPSRVALDEGRRLLREHFGVALHADSGTSELRRRLIDQLDRPLRVCAMVRNTGEPGGGPFWVVDGPGNASQQIVERAQVDANGVDQQKIFAASTHFNPVDIVCGLRDRRNRPFDLSRFVDPQAVFISRKSEDGREIEALERPGLWNGAMSGWRTVFVEVPIETFAPVKTVWDLLRPEHQDLRTEQSP